MTNALSNNELAIEPECQQLSYKELCTVFWKNVWICKHSRHLSWNDIAVKIGEDPRKIRNAYNRKSDPGLILGLKLARLFSTTGEAMVFGHANRQTQNWNIDGLLEENSIVGEKIVLLEDFIRLLGRCHVDDQEQ